MIKGYSELENHTLRTRFKQLRLEGDDYHDLLKKFQALDGIPCANYADYRRGGEKVRQAILGSIAALYDAGAAPSDSIPILGCGCEGSFAENLLYFDDYTGHGRDGGRGQLFVGTLPTTPLCEAAIALNMHGPAFYIDPGNNREQLRQEIGLCFADPAVSGLLLLEFTGKRLRAFYLERGGEGEPCDF